MPIPCWSLPRTLLEVLKKRVTSCLETCLHPFCFCLPMILTMLTGKRYFVDQLVRSKCFGHLCCWFKSSRSRKAYTLLTFACHILYSSYRERKVSPCILRRLIISRSVKGLLFFVMLIHRVTSPCKRRVAGSSPCFPLKKGIAQLVEQEKHSGRFRSHFFALNH